MNRHKKRIKIKIERGEHVAETIDLNELQKKYDAQKS